MQLIKDMSLTVHSVVRFTQLLLKELVQFETQIDPGAPADCRENN